MARTPRSRPEVEATAAYAVSQPLFDALRAATTSIDEQRLHLVTARDLIQQVHIQAPHANGAHDVEKYDRFLESATRAWKCTTEVFSNIFETLANVTGPDATTGREATQEHHVFKDLARTAANAKEVVADYVVRHTEDASRAVHDEAGSTGFKDEYHRSGHTASGEGEDRVARNRKRAPSASEALPLQHRPPKMLKVVKAAARAPLSGHVHERSQQNRGAEQSATPKVEYEDVSTEISARLKAKEEKKKAKKDAKKRKRESNDSFLEPVVALHDTSILEKPQRKKPKGGDRDMIGERKTMEVRSKRKKSVSTIASQDGKKRKTKS